MSASDPLIRHRRPAAWLAVLGGLLVTISTVRAQQVVNPGDIIVERTVTPRSAFANVPHNQDPVAVRATTFPANTFNPSMAQLVTDTDLVNAHGSSGVAGSGALAGTGMQAITQALSGNATGSNVALGGSAIGRATGGLGTTISSTVTGALAPLTGALGGMK